MSETSYHNELPAMQFAQRVVSYLEGAMSRDEVATFDRELQGSRAKRQLMAQLCYQARTIREMLTDRLTLDTNGSEPMEPDTATLLAEVLDQERSAKRRDAIRRADREMEAADDRGEVVQWLMGHASIDTTPIRHVVIPRWTIYGAVAALLIMAVLIARQFAPRDASPPIVAPSDPVAQSNPEPRRDEAPLVVGHLREAVDATWEDASIALGDAMTAGMHHLASGWARIEMIDGAQVIVEGPAVFRLDSESSMRLVVGRIVGHCPPGAEGFAVRTASARIIDLGTEFGVAVDETSATEVHVFAGEIEVVAARQSIEHRLVADQAARIDPAGETVEPIAADAFAFTRGMEPGHRDPMRRYVHAVKKAGPIAYWRFESAAGGIVANEMGYRYRGVIVGDARLNNDARNRALVLGDNGSTGVVMVEPIAALAGAEHYSFECWIRPHGYQHGSIVRVLAGAGRADSTFQLELVGEYDHLNLPSRSLRFMHRHDTSQDVRNEQTTNVVSPSPYALDRWQHIVATKAGADMRLYIDGRLAATGRDERPLASVVHEIILGGHEPDAPSELRNRQFRGELDEVAVYDRALTEEEVRDHYESFPKEVD